MLCKFVLPVTFFNSPKLILYQLLYCGMYWQPLLGKHHVSCFLCGLTPACYATMGRLHFLWGLLRGNSGKAMFSLWSIPGLYSSDISWQWVSSEWVAEKRTVSYVLGFQPSELQRRVLGWRVSDGKWCHELWDTRLSVVRLRELGETRL
jgi:hypothetical protein